MTADIVSPGAAVRYWTLVLPGLFLDHLLPAIEVEVPHRTVEIDRRFFDALEEIVVQRPIVHGVIAPSRPLPMPSRTVVGPSNGKTRYGPVGTPQTPSV